MSSNLSVDSFYMKRLVELQNDCRWHVNTCQLEEVDRVVTTAEKVLHDYKVYLKKRAERLCCLARFFYQTFYTYPQRASAEKIFNEIVNISQTQRRKREKQVLIQHLIVEPVNISSQQEIQALRHTFYLGNGNLV